MRKMMTALVLPPLVAALALGGCGEKTPSLAADPIGKAADCGVIAAASAREAAGIKGDLPAEAQERIAHYPLLAASAGEKYDADTADKVFKAMPKTFDSIIKGKWQTLRPACASAFPATAIQAPALPERPLDSMLQCYVLADYLRKALGGEGSAYGQAINDYGVFTAKLDTKMTPALAKAGLKNGPALQAKRAEELAAAAKLGPPPAVMKLCRAKFR